MTGLAELQSRMRTLPPNTYIALMTDRDAGLIEPPSSVVEKIREYAKTIGLRFAYLPTVHEWSN
jgi:hypothetical protein